MWMFKELSLKYLRNRILPSLIIHSFIHSLIHSPKSTQRGLWRKQGRSQTFLNVGKLQQFLMHWMKPSLSPYLGYEPHFTVGFCPHFTSWSLSLCFGPIRLTVSHSRSQTYQASRPFHSQHALVYLFHEELCHPTDAFLTDLASRNSPPVPATVPDTCQ